MIQYAIEFVPLATYLLVHLSMKLDFPVNHSVIYEETLKILCQLFLYRQFTCVFFLDAQSLQVVLPALNVKNYLLTFTSLSPSYYLSDICPHCGITVGVGHPYSNPLDMANVQCQGWWSCWLCWFPFISSEL